VATSDLEQTARLPKGKETSTSAAERDELEPGTLVGPYNIHSTLGSGGGGQVYRAEHRLLGRSVAIKVLHAENAGSHEGLARFVREARVVNMIRHPAIVDIYEFGELPDGRPYFVMELLEGSDVSRLINAQGRFDPQEMLQIITQVCSALEAAHSAGVVHRDLKANNVNVAVRDGRYIVKLLDFGIAKLLAPDENTAGLTQAGSRLGTATAMSPEQIRGEPVDQRTDIYALGVLIYHMLTGRYPFMAPTAQETDRMNLESPVPRPSQSVPVPAALDAIVLRCMEKIPDRRYQSAKTVLEALRAAVEGTAPTQEMVRPRQAVGVYVDVTTAPGSDSGDEALFDDVADVLDLAERMLNEAGLSSVLNTGSSLLSVRVLPDKAGPGTPEETKAREKAQALAQRIATRPEAHPQVIVKVHVHVDVAEVQGSPASPVVTGRIVEVAAWPPATALVTTT
jgi:serine/threonine protein kinase